MNLDLALILLMLAAAIVMFVINRPRMDAVALLVMVSMPFTGIITVNEALAGFADPSIILIAALFVIGEGLVRTGVARRLGDWLDAKAGSSENRLLILLMAAAGPAADGRLRSRCRRGRRPGWSRRAAFRIGDLVRHHRGVRLVHLQYGHGRTDGAGGAGHRQGPRSLALSVCDDRRAGRVRSFHDAYLLARKHAGRGTRAI
jgi:hypothetical protein